MAFAHVVRVLQAVTVTVETVVVVVWTVVVRVVWTVVVVVVWTVVVGVVWTVVVEVRAFPEVEALGVELLRANVMRERERERQVKGRMMGWKKTREG